MQTHNNKNISILYYKYNDIDLHILEKITKTDILIYNLLKNNIDITQDHQKLKDIITNLNKADNSNGNGNFSISKEDIQKFLDNRSKIDEYIKEYNILSQETDILEISEKDYIISRIYLDENKYKKIYDELKEKYLFKKDSGYRDIKDFKLFLSNKISIKELIEKIEQNNNKEKDENKKIDELNTEINVLYTKIDSLKENKNNIKNKEEEIKNIKNTLFNKGYNLFIMKKDFLESSPNNSYLSKEFREYIYNFINDNTEDYNEIKKINSYLQGVITERNSKIKEKEELINILKEIERKKEDNEENQKNIIKDKIEIDENNYKIKKTKNDIEELDKNTQRIEKDIQGLERDIQNLERDIQGLEKDIQNLERDKLKEENYIQQQKTKYKKDRDNFLRKEEEKVKNLNKNITVKTEGKDDKLKRVENTKNTKIIGIEEKIAGLNIKVKQLEEEISQSDNTSTLSDYISISSILKKKDVIEDSILKINNNRHNYLEDIISKSIENYLDNTKIFDDIDKDILLNEDKLIRNSTQTYKEFFRKFDINEELYKKLFNNTKAILLRRYKKDGKDDISKKLEKIKDKEINISNNVFNEYISLYDSILEKRKKEENKNNKKNGERIKKTKYKISELKNKISEERRNIKDIENDYKYKIKEIEEDYKRDIKDIEDEIKTIKNDLYIDFKSIEEEFQLNINSVKKDIEYIEKNILSAQNNIFSINKNKEDLEKEIEKLKKEINNNENKQRTLNSEIDNIIYIIENKEKEIENYKKNIEINNRYIEEYEPQIFDIKKEIKLFNKIIEKTLEDITENKRKIEKIEKKINDKYIINENNILGKEQLKIEDINLNLVREKNKIKSDIDYIKSDIKSKKILIEDITSSIQEIDNNRKNITSVLNNIWQYLDIYFQNKENIYIPIIKYIKDNNLEKGDYNSILEYNLKRKEKGNRLNEIKNKLTFLYKASNFIQNYKIDELILRILKKYKIEDKDFDFIQNFIENYKRELDKTYINRIINISLIIGLTIIIGFLINLYIGFYR